MEEKVLAIVNEIRYAKGLTPKTELKPEYDLRNDLEFTSFDLAELTVKVEDEFDVDIFEEGIITNVGEIYEKLNNKQ